MKLRGIVLILLLLLAIVPLTSAQGSTFGLSTEDFSLFTNAATANAGLNAFQFDFLFTFALSGVPDAGNISVDLSGTGALDTSGANPAFQLTLNGTANAPEQTQVDAEIRMVDGIIYVDALDPYTGSRTGWTGVRADELSSFASSNFATGFEQGSGGIPFDQSMLTGFTASLAAIDPSQFVTISRLADETVGDTNTNHFSANVSLTDFANTDAFAALLGAAATAGGATDFAPTDLTGMSQMVSMMLTDSRITLDQYFGADDQLLRRAALNVGLEVNPAMLGATQPINISLNFAIDLTDHNQPQTVTAPEGVEVSSLSVPADISTIPTIAVPTTIVATPEVNLPTPTPVQQEQPGPTGSLVANVANEVQLTGTGAVDLTYNGTANEVIGVTARSLETAGVLDTTLEILDSTGTRLAFNDDHGTTRTDLQTYDSSVRDLKLTSSGTLTIRVSTFTGAGTGRVEVLLTSSSAGAVVPTATPVTQTGSTGPQVITGVVPEGGEFEQPIGFQSGEVVTITVRSTDNALDPKVELDDPNGVNVAENDDHADDDPSLDNLDSRISDFTISSGGTYTIQISGFAGSGGSFELTIERSGGGSTVATTPPLATPTQVGSTSGTSETVQGSISPNGTFTYELNAQAGDVYTITVEATTNDFDPRVSIYDPSEAFLIANDDHGTSATDIGSFDSRIENFIMPASGSYQIEVNGYQDSSGSFNLTVEQVGTGAPLGAGTDQVFTGEVRSGGTFTQTFDAQAGDFVTITVRSLTQDFDPRAALLSPSGVIVADNDDVGLSATDIGVFDSRITNFMITETGTYTVEVQGYQTSSGSFALTINTRR